MEQSKSKRVAQQLYRGISGATVAPHGSNDSSMPRSARGVSLESKRAVPTESQPSASSSSTSSSSAALAAPALSSDASGAAAVPATVSCYLRHCHAYQTAPCAAIIVVLRFRGTTLRPAVTSPRFGDMDLLPFCECLMDASVAPLLNHIASLDFFNCALTAHGVSMLAHALMSNTSIALLRLDNNAIGSYGAKQIELLFRTNTTITALSLSNCALGSRGGTFIATLLANPTHSLADIDLTNNILGNRAVSECRAALATQKARGARIIKCDLDGNQVVAEILNSVTHFLGLLLCLVGTVYLLDATRADPSQSEADRDVRF